MSPRCLALAHYFSALPLLPMISTNINLPCVSRIQEPQRPSSAPAVPPTPVTPESTQLPLQLPLSLPQVLLPRTKNVPPVYNAIGHQRNSTSSVAAFFHKAPILAQPRILALAPLAAGNLILKRIWRGQAHSCNYMTSAPRSSSKITAVCSRPARRLMR
jgi:hypothetical protein